ncbi:MAG TPA: 3-keto-5-aminohexanoate cleavage protein [Gemmatimonadales bacterium]
MLLQAAINGARAPAEHPALPARPDELAAAARACVAAGAGAVHFHVRGANGGESLGAADLARAVTAVRGACRGTPLGVSTGAWIEPDPERRLALIRRWHVLPDYASVNFDEPGAVEIAEELLELGVGVEAGLSGLAAAESLLRADLVDRCLRVLLEPQEQEPAAALDTVGHIVRTLASADGIPRLLHGVDATAWPLLREAVRRGYDARIGLEDTLRLPGGELAGDNLDLIRAAKAWISG